MSGQRKTKRLRRWFGVSVPSIAVFVSCLFFSVPVLTHAEDLIVTDTLDTIGSNPASVSTYPVIFSGNFIDLSSSDIVIYDVSVSAIGPTTATITWTTSVLADSKVDYGPTISYGNIVTGTGAPVLVHTVALNGLTPGSLNHFRVRSADSSGLDAFSDDYDFYTPVTGTPKSQPIYYVPEGVSSENPDPNVVILSPRRTTSRSREPNRPAVIPGVTSQANSGLVPCGNTDTNTSSPTYGTIPNPCGWDDLITLVINVTNYLIILGAAFSAVAFGWAGFLMMTAGGEMSKIQEAKSIFMKVLIGFLLMLSAWLIVRAIEAGFIAPESGIESLLLES